MKTINADTTVGASPKVQNSLLVGLAWFLLSKLGIPWDPIVEQFINVLLMVLAGVLSKPGEVEVPTVDPSAGDVKAP